MQHIILRASLSGALGVQPWDLFTASLHKERGKELERWKRHEGMSIEVEIDKSAVGLKTLMQKSCVSQR